MWPADLMRSRANLLLRNSSFSLPATYFSRLSYLPISVRPLRSRFSLLLQTDPGVIMYL